MSKQHTKCIKDIDNMSVDEILNYFVYLDTDSFDDIEVERYLEERERLFTKFRQEMITG